MTAPICDRLTCRGHRVFVGGRLDGEITHLTAAAPGDYFLTLGTRLADGQRSWYLRDGDQRHGDVFYRFVGVSREKPAVIRAALDKLPAPSKQNTEES